MKMVIEVFALYTGINIGRSGTAKFTWFLADGSSVVADRFVEYKQV